MRSRCGCQKGPPSALRYVYDNSAENPLNPNHPPARVVSGNRSSDEMCHLWLQVLPVDFDRSAGRSAHGCCRRRWRGTTSRKTPADFEAHYNLAAMLQAANNLDGAIPRV